VRPLACRVLVVAAAAPVLAAAVVPANSVAAPITPAGIAGMLPVRGLLIDVAAISPRIAWAVGQTGLCQTTTLITRWDGSTWKVMRVPAAAHRGSLDGIAVLSVRNAWAVGTADTAGGGQRALVLRWNGTAWTKVRTAGGARGVSLAGVAAVSARDAWAVGSTGAGRTYTARWDGTAWTRVRSPSPGGESLLTGVAATSARNAWAVGGILGRPGRALIMHWNGTAWARVPATGLPAGSFLERVAMTSPRAGWAVGTVGFDKTLIARWNGKTWQRVSSPDVAGQLTGVTATSARNAWAVGVTPSLLVQCGASGQGPLAPAVRLGARAGRFRSLIWHWNGTAWKQAMTPNLPGGSGLAGVTATSADSAWAVGGAGNNLGPKSKALALRWNGSRWR